MYHITERTKFNLRAHQANFIDYLEVIILKDGTIEYAVPSHLEKAIKIYCEEKGISREELFNLIPLTDSPLDWIINEIGIISVWYDLIIAPSKITEEQLHAIEFLLTGEVLNTKYIKYMIYINNYGNLSSKVVRKYECY